MLKPTGLSITADTVERVTDLDRIAEVVLHPEVRPFVGDDFTPADWKPDDGALYLMAPGMVFTFVPLSMVLWEAHAAALPAVRGTVSSVGRDAVRWMFENTACRSIVSMIPEHNIPAQALARRVGMERVGRLSRAFMRKGSLCDLVIYGVSDA